MKKGNLRISVVAGFSAGLMVLSTPTAHALVTFDPSSGKGWVGKGDVQLAFGWNNKQLQQNQIAVSFQYNEHSTFDVTCTYEQITGRGSVIKTSERNNISNVLGKLSADSRLKTQYTGWYLNGFGDWQSSGDPVPMVGDSCVAAGTTGVVTDVTVPIVEGKLQAVFNSLSVIIWTIPPVTTP